MDNHIEEHYNDWLEIERLKSTELDYLNDYLRHTCFFHKLYKRTRWLWLAKFLLNFKHFVRQNHSSYYIGSFYQEILISHIKDIEKILDSIEYFPSKLSRIQCLDVNGYDIFNATSINLFGEMSIAIQSGIFYYAHILSRSIEISLQFARKKMELPRWQKWWAKNKYAAVAESMIVNDHKRALSKIILVPEDDSLLFGIEMFIIAHEYAHLMFKEYDIDDFHFEEYFSPDLISLIKNDEEIAADAFAVIVVSQHFFNNMELTMFQYGPLFLFKNLALFSSLKLQPEPKSHPRHNDRHAYLYAMITMLHPNNDYGLMDMKLVEIFNSVKKRIYKRAKRKIRQINELHEIHEDVIYHIKERYNSLYDDDGCIIH